LDEHLRQIKCLLGRDLTLTLVSLW